MSSDTPWKSSKQNDFVESSPKGEPESRFVDAKEMEQRGTYKDHYQRIYPLLMAGELDFRQIAKETGLKERKIRDVLLSRLANDDMIQLFGHRDGVCYVCASRMRGNLTDEPLCIPCIEAIVRVVVALHPTAQDTANPSTEVAPIAAIGKPVAAVSNLPPTPPDSEPMVPKSQFDAVYQELERYRKKYGPLDDFSDALAPSHKDSSALAAEAGTNSSAASVSESLSDPTTAVSGRDIWDILEGNNDDPEGPDADINYVTLSPNDTSKATDLLGQSTGEPLRHFGFQRLRSRN